MKTASTRPTCPSIIPTCRFAPATSHSGQFESCPLVIPVSFWPKFWPINSPARARIKADWTDATSRGTMLCTTRRTVSHDTRRVRIPLGLPVQTYVCPTIGPTAPHWRFPIERVTSTARSQTECECRARPLGAARIPGARRRRPSEACVPVIYWNKARSRERPRCVFNKH
jgi:hypothetical protein